MKKIDDTIQEIRASFAENDTPICWLSSSRSSILLAAMVQMVRRHTPVLVFPEFWSAEKRHRMFNMVDEMKVQAFYFSPVTVRNENDQIESTYQTDSFTLNQADLLDASLMEKIVTFEARPKLIPSYLWTHTFIAEKPDAVFIGEKTQCIFPLENWTDAEIKEAYDFLSLPSYYLTPETIGEGQCQTSAI